MSVISKKMWLKNVILTAEHIIEKNGIFALVSTPYMLQNSLRQAHLKNLGYIAKIWNIGIILNTDSSIWVLL
jgi:hypothetical protein